MIRIALEADEAVPDYLHTCVHQLGKFLTKQRKVNTQTHITNDLTA